MPPHATSVRPTRQAASRAGVQVGAATAGGTCGYSPSRAAGTPSAARGAGETRYRLRRGTLTHHLTRR